MLIKMTLVSCHKIYDSSSLRPTLAWLTAIFAAIYTPPPIILLILAGIVTSSTETAKLASNATYATRHSLVGTDWNVTSVPFTAILQKINHSPPSTPRPSRPRRIFVENTCHDVLFSGVGAETIYVMSFMTHLIHVRLRAIVSTEPYRKWLVRTLWRRSSARLAPLCNCH